MSAKLSTDAVLEAVPVPMFNVYGSKPKPVTYVADGSRLPGQ